MKKDYFISVIIPIYNGSKYMEKCLSTIESSAYDSYEVTIVDDGSMMIP